MKKGLTLIELLVAAAIISLMSGIGAVSIDSYKRASNNFNVKFTQNTILAFIDYAKQYCRENDAGGYLTFDMIENKIVFYRNLSKIDLIIMPEGIKLESINSENNQIDINRYGITSDACTIIFRDKYKKLHHISICVGTAFVNLKD